MSDGVAITAGSGTTILTDDTGAGGHAQVVKLAIATDGSAALIPADATDGMLVNLGANNDITVTGTVTANLAAGANNIGDVDVLTIAAGDNNIGNVDVVTVPADPFGVNADAASATGSVSAKLRFIAATGIPITALPASTNTIEVVGDAAHDAGIAGNPVSIGGVSIDMDDTAPPNQVSAEAEAVRLGMDRDGAIFAHPHGPRLWSFHSDGSSALTDTSVHAAPAAGLSLYVTDIVISTGAATAMNVFFEEGASKVLGPYYLEAVAGRGLHIKFATPKKITAATALTVTTSQAIAQCIDVMGYTAPG